METGQTGIGHGILAVAAERYVGDSRGRTVGVAATAPPPGIPIGSTVPLAVVRRFQRRLAVTA